MESSRRLVLLAVIIVAVAIGAVGLTLVSLFQASLEQQRQSLALQLATDDPEGIPGNVATVAREGTQWRPEGALAVPAGVYAAMSAVVSGNPPIGNTTWLYDDDGTVLVGVRVLDTRHLRLAWLSMDDLREPFHRAALQAGIGLVVLLAIGLALFWRMTTPLLRSLDTSEARYRTLFSGTAEGVLLVGERIEECNDRACEMFGCRREDIVGVSWQDFFRRQGGDESRLATFGERVDAAMRGHGEPFTWTFPRGAGNSSLVVEIALRRIGQDAGTQVLASLRDVTLREEATRALRMAEHTLRESRDKLADAGRNRALVELAAGIAHEVNQPLTAIANYAQASRRLVVPGQACPEDVAQALDRIAEQAQRAGDAIHRIRALVDASPRVGSDRTCINRLVREVVDLVKEEIDRAGASITLDLSDDMVPIIADPLQIQQVVVQLLRNALDAVSRMPPERRRVTIASRRTGEQVEVSVSDEGGGIAPDDQHRLFEPFYSTRQGAMGMGLAISLSIIRSHTGELEFDPDCGRGACFRFRLPADTHHEGSDETCRDTAAP